MATAGGKPGVRLCALKRTGPKLKAESIAATEWCLEFYRSKGKLSYVDMHTAFQQATSLKLSYCQFSARAKAAAETAAGGVHHCCDLRQRVGNCECSMTPECKRTVWKRGVAEASMKGLRANLVSYDSAEVTVLIEGGASMTLHVGGAVSERGTSPTLLLLAPISGAARNYDTKHYCGSVLRWLTRQWGPLTRGRVAEAVHEALAPLGGDGRDGSYQPPPPNAGRDACTAVLLQDNAPMHTSQAARDARRRLRIPTIFTPAAECRDLNPIECLWEALRKWARSMKPLPAGTTEQVAVVALSEGWRSMAPMAQALLAAWFAKLEREATAAVTMQGAGLAPAPAPPSSAFTWVATLSEEWRSVASKMQAHMAAWLAKLQRKATAGFAKRGIAKAPAPALTRRKRTLVAALSEECSSVAPMAQAHMAAACSDKPEREATTAAVTVRGTATPPLAPTRSKRTWVAALSEERRNVAPAAAPTRSKRTRCV